MNIYLASPFFNEEQSACVGELEGIIRGLGHQLWSPREMGKLGDSLGKTYAERKAAAKNVFESNVMWMNNSEVILAVVDWSDTGTMFEFGFAYAKSIPVVAYTRQKEKALNIMLQEAVVAFCHGPEEITGLFKLPPGDSFYARCLDYQSFSSEMI